MPEPNYVQVDINDPTQLAILRHIMRKYEILREIRELQTELASVEIRIADQTKHLTDDPA